MRRSSKSLCSWMPESLLVRALGLMFVIAACTAPNLAARGAPRQQEFGKSDSPQERGPVIRTDRKRYLAGTSVRVSATGFSPFETVRLRVTHAGSAAEAGMGHEPWVINADGDGTFKSTWLLNMNDAAGMDFALEATGSSGSTAQTQFVRAGFMIPDRPSYGPGDTARITAY